MTTILLELDCGDKVKCMHHAIHWLDSTRREEDVTTINLIASALKLAARHLQTSWDRCLKMRTMNE